MQNEPIIGHGVFSWDGSERRTDRYGAFTVSPCGFAKAPLVPAGWSRAIFSLEGQRCRITVRVVEVRQSGHCGDMFRGIGPSQPEVGEVIDLGIGTLFDPDWDWSEGVGLFPDDGRESNWFDPAKLYRLHDQVVEVTITPVADDVGRESTAAPEVDPFPFTMGIANVPGEGNAAQVKGRHLK